MAADEAEARIGALENEIAHLRRALTSHTVIDQAIGVVVAVGRVTPERGWEVLVEISQQTNTKLREVAEHVVRGAHSRRLPDGVHRAFTAALARAKGNGARPDGTRPRPDGRGTRAADVRESRGEGGTTRGDGQGTRPDGRGTAADGRKARTDGRGARADGDGPPAGGRAPIRPDGAGTRGRPGR